MAEITPAHYSQCGCHTAQGDRQVTSSLVCSEGVALTVGNGLAVIQNSPAAMSVKVRSGNAFIQGDNSAWQGMYHISNDGDVTLAITAADVAEDRLDLVIAEVRDSTYSGADCDWQLRVVTGTPGSPPVQPALPVNAILLAVISVGAGVSSIATADITDERSAYELCSVPATTLPTVLSYPAPGIYSVDMTDYPGATRIIAQLQGGGGGGGAALSTSSLEAAVGTGGGAGAWAELEIIPSLVDGGQLIIIVGEGGVGGTNSTPPVDGSATGIQDFSTTYDCNGGSGGNNGTNAVPPFFNPSPGAGGTVDSPIGGSGCLGRVTAHSGSPGLAALAVGTADAMSGAGGKSVTRAGGAARGANGAGSDGASGSGGSGARNGSSQGSRNGGDGGDGYARLFIYTD